MCGTLSLRCTSFPSMYQTSASDDPSVVVEIITGVVLGLYVLGWVQVDLPVQVLFVLGLAFLLFLTGLEIDLSALRGRALRVAGFGYGLTERAL